jgi:hypothetical protein
MSRIITRRPAGVSLRKKIQNEVSKNFIVVRYVIKRYFSNLICIRRNNNANIFGMNGQFTNVSISSSSGSDKLLN